MILFHGNLIHSGAKAKMEDISDITFCSFNYSKDLQMFGYLNKYNTDAWKIIQNSETYDPSCVLNTANHSTDSSIGTSFKPCLDFKKKV